MAKHYREEKDCLNCGNTVADKFCSQCGQENLVPKETFKHIMSHFITDYLHLDEKLFGSLKPLIFNPGKLTNEYNSGKRMQFVNPLRLYIFISLIYFLISFNFIKSKGIVTATQGSEVINAKIDSISNSNIGKVKKSKSSLQQSEVEEKLALSKEKLRIKDSIQQSFVIDSNEYFPLIDSSEAQYLSRQDSLLPAKKHGTIQRFLNVKAFRMMALKNTIGERINKTIQENLPKVMFVMLPIFALLLSIFFRRSKKYYVEHFFHSVHIHSFIFLIFTLFGLLGLLFPQAKEWLDWLVLLIIGIYIYKSMMRVYQENGVITIIKILFSSIIYFVFLTFGVIIALGISYLFL